MVTSQMICSIITQSVVLTLLNEESFLPCPHLTINLDLFCVQNRICQRISNSNFVCLVYYTRLTVGFKYNKLTFVLSGYFSLFRLILTPPTVLNLLTYLKHDFAHFTMFLIMKIQCNIEHKLIAALSWLKKNKIPPKHKHK